PVHLNLLQKPSERLAARRRRGGDSQESLNLRPIQTAVSQSLLELPVQLHCGRGNLLCQTRRMTARGRRKNGARHCLSPSFSTSRRAPSRLGPHRKNRGSQQRPAV